LSASVEEKTMRENTVWSLIDT